MGEACERVIGDHHNNISLENATIGLDMDLSSKHCSVH